jgi:hypothetical protein
MTDLYRIFVERRFGRLLLVVFAPETMSCAEKSESGVAVDMPCLLTCMSISESK